MIIHPKYRILVLLLFTAMAGCNPRFDERVSLWRKDKIPYGTYYAYNNLEYIFRDAEIETFSKSPTAFYELEETSSAYIIIGNTVKPDEKELRAILNYVVAGNHVFISALNIGKNMLDSFNLSLSSGDYFMDGGDSMSVNIFKPGTSDSILFSYPGKALEKHFTKMDSTITTILGQDQYGNANFIKFTYEKGGSVLLHLAPAAFTNFFLLHKQNKKYYDISLSAIPDSVNSVRWDDYYRYHLNGNNESEQSTFSKLDVFLTNEVLRWAFWLTLLLFGIVYLFESKRKQRVLPVIKKLSNTSLDFVQTIGRLYFQRKDNNNLAAKMVTHFLMHVRTTYNLATSTLDEAFENKLAYKSGHPVESVREILRYIHAIEQNTPMSDEALLDFNHKTDTFINKA